MINIDLSDKSVSCFYQLNRLRQRASVATSEELRRRSMQEMGLFVHYPYCHMSLLGIPLDA